MQIVAVTAAVVSTVFIPMVYWYHKVAGTHGSALVVAAVVACVVVAYTCRQGRAYTKNMTPKSRTLEAYGLNLKFHPRTLPALRQQQVLLLPSLILLL